MTLTKQMVAVKDTTAEGHKKILLMRTINIKMSFLNHQNLLYNLPFGGIRLFFTSQGVVNQTFNVTTIYYMYIHTHFNRVCIYA